MIKKKKKVLKGKCCGKIIETKVFE